MESLKDDADIGAAKTRKPVFVEPAKVRFGNHDRAVVGALKSRHHHEQRRFAGARRAKQADRFAAPYIQGDIFEDMNAIGAAAEREIDRRNRDRVADERVPRNVIHVRG